MNADIEQRLAKLEEVVVREIAYRDRLETELLKLRIDLARLAAAPPSPPMRPSRQDLRHPAS